MSNKDPENPPAPEQLKVRLLECSRRSCSYILSEEERLWVPNERWKGMGGKSATCPKCGGDSFFTLNEVGQRITSKDREKYRDGLVLAEIQPSPKMGSKRRHMLLAAKDRALAANSPAIPESSAPTPWGYDLWAHLHEEHGLTLTESELHDIVRKAAPLVKDLSSLYAGGEG